ncbi:MAG: GNAT family N-acetyltransferase [Algoriphagus sp.]|nr:GNAT family N-acetyltransferase [Algoriphagus sp.]
MAQDSFEIIPFSPDLQPYFESINSAWVSQYFSLESFDLAQLKNPEETISAKGGEIIFARIGDTIVGTVALIPGEEGVWEMIKMGVDPAFQGKGAGKLLGKHILAIARQKGATKVCLYTHTKLEAALKLYHRLGFVPCELECGAYGRCNLKMEYTF